MNRNTNRGLLRTTSTSLYYGFLGLAGAAPKHEAHKAPGEFHVLRFQSARLSFCLSVCVQTQGKNSHFFSQDTLRTAHQTVANEDLLDLNFMTCRNGCGAGLRSLRAAVRVFLHGLSAGNKSLLSVSLLSVSICVALDLKLSLLLPRQAQQFA